jgi:16S rRNA processing protein RimM
VLPEWDWTIGEVVAPFGRRGEVKVKILTDFPERFAELKRVCLRPKTRGPALMEVQATRLHKGQALLKLTGVESIDDAETWRGSIVQVRRGDAVPLQDDSHYIDDIVGMEVWTVQGRLVGALSDVLHYPAQDLLVVGDALIPAVRPIVVEVDQARRRIVIDPPEGLLPEAPAPCDSTS